MSTCSATCQTGSVCKRNAVSGKSMCWQHQKRRKTVEVFFIRHAFSCANSIEYFGGMIDQLKRAIYLDPPLTDQSLRQFKTAGRPSNLDLILCSTMRRAEETALYLFPEADEIFPVPYMKEVGLGAGNKIAKHISDQQAALGPEKSARLNYKYVTGKDGDWTKGARESHYHKFLELMAQIVSEVPKDHVRIAIVTHSNFMKKDIFKTKDKPLNVGVGLKRYWLDADGQLVEADDSPTVDTWSKQSEGVPFVGVEMPQTINKDDVERCAYKPSFGGKSSLAIKK